MLTRAILTLTFVNPMNALLVAPWSVWVGRLAGQALKASRRTTTATLSRIEQLPSKGDKRSARKEAVG